MASDLVVRNRELAEQMGADSSFDPSGDDLSCYCAAKGYFDVSFEASGAIPAVQKNIEMTRPRGTMVLVGMPGGMVELPLTRFLVKEICLVGSFRFTDEYITAVRWLENGTVDPRPLLTRVMPYTEIVEALELAADKTKALKVQLSFG